MERAMREGCKEIKITRSIIIDSYGNQVGVDVVKTLTLRGKVMGIIKITGLLLVAYVGISWSLMGYVDSFRFVGM